MKKIGSWAALFLGGIVGVGAMMAATRIFNPADDKTDNKEEQKQEQYTETVINGKDLKVGDDLSGYRIRFTESADAFLNKIKDCLTDCDPQMTTISFEGDAEFYFEISILEDGVLDYISFVDGTDTMYFYADGEFNEDFVFPSDKPCVVFEIDSEYDYDFYIPYLEYYKVG